MVFGVCALSVLSGAALPRFMIYIMPLFSRKPSEKIILSLGPRFGSELLVFGVCALSMLSGAALPRLLLYIMPLFSRKPSEKISLVLRSAFLRKFSGANFWYVAYVLCRCLLVLFCLGFCSILCLCSPESCLKKFSCAQIRVSEKNFGSELLVFGVCALSMLFGAALPRLLLYIMPLFSRKPSEKFSCP